MKVRSTDVIQAPEAPISLKVRERPHSKSIADPGPVLDRGFDLVSDLGGENVPSLMRATVEVAQWFSTWVHIRITWEKLKKKPMPKVPEILILIGPG